MGKHIQPPVFPVVMQAGDILQEPRQDNRCVSESLTDRESWLWSVSKNEAVSFPAPLSVHSLPVHGQGLQTGIVAFFCPHPVVRVRRRRQDRRVPANVVGGEHPSPLPTGHSGSGRGTQWPQNHGRHPMVSPAARSRPCPAPPPTTDGRSRQTAFRCPFHVRPERPPCIPGMSFSCRKLPLRFLRVPGFRKIQWAHRPPSEERQPAVPVFV